jgi:uncharacterized membrane-anchored protein YitT (DUF2179 family)
LTGHFDTWMYAWALIPGFVGVGVVLARLLGDESREGYRSGFRLILISVILFILFYIFLGREGSLRSYWPVLLILLGLWMFIQAILRKR